jgi:uncharacterized protein (TIGR00255 family)
MNYPCSMTAFGRGEASANGRVWTVELRSVNHRYLDVKIKMPRKYAGFEEQIKREIGTCYSRGHVDVMVTVSGEGTDSLKLVANLPLAHEYQQCLNAIRHELHLPDPPTLAMLKDCRDVITAVEAPEDVENAWPELAEALKMALESTRCMREAEGEATKVELLGRLAGFEAAVAAIEAEIPGLVANRGEKLKERLTTLLAGVNLDPVRLAQEVAVMADKSDVTEEIVRLRSHIEQFRRFLAAPEPAGRRLDFLLQEFFREINTMASKISEVTISHQTVEMKNEVEKLREQVQNLE